MKNLFKKYLFLFLLSSFALAGCQTTTGYYKGAKADQETIISVADKANGVRHWKDLYVDIDYSFKQQGNQLLVDGILAFSGYPKQMMASVKDFKLKLFLLDQDGRVLDYYDLKRTVSSSLDQKTAFGKSVQMPAGTVAMSFGYEGEFVGDYHASEVVSELPKRSL